jgi:peptidoglycan/LPS O-acetylase OafA/YrhL
MLTKVGAARFWPDLIAHIFLVHGLIPQTVLPSIAFTLLGVAWTLSLEEQFYAVAPFAVRSATQNLAARVLLFALTIAAAWWYAPIAAYFSNAFLPANLLFFVAGGLSHFALANEPDRRAVLKFAAIPGAMTILLRAIGARTILESWLPVSIWAVLIAGIATKRANFTRSILSSSWMQFLGRVSYSTYLFHMVVITLVQAMIWKFKPAIARPTLLITTLALSTIGTVAVSYLSWRFVERPFQLLGRRGPK